MENRDKVYLHNILDAVDDILTYTEGIDEQHFLNQKMLQDAVIRKFEIIGEATKGLSKELRTKNDNVSWRKMAGMRDKLIHHYMGVDLKTVWDTVVDILPGLKVQIRQLLKNE